MKTQLEAWLLGTCLVLCMICTRFHSDKVVAYDFAIEQVEKNIKTLNLLLDEEKKSERIQGGCRACWDQLNVDALKHAKTEKDLKYYKFIYKQLKDTKDHGTSEQ